MFNMFGMLGTYPQRMVKNDKFENFILDTARVTDRPWIYETAVSHKEFNNGDWIILQGTDTKDEAIKVHDEWLEKIKNGVDELRDIFEDKVFKKGE